jgi:hypothetical protein
LSACFIESAVHQEPANIKSQCERFLKLFEGNGDGISKISEIAEIDKILIEY